MQRNSSYRLEVSVVPFLLLAATSACGGAAGEAIRPKDFTASGVTAMNSAPACSGDPRLAKPLIVDLDADARLDLEASMDKQLVVVAYDCNQLRVLPACSAGRSKYEYAGVSRKEQVVQMKSQDDLSVNLPLSAGKLGSDLTSGKAIDLALVMVGRRSTTLARVEQDDLVGNCEGATHYLQSAYLGAFSMATGSVGKVAVVADLFKVGASAKSASDRKSANSDGSLEACHTSSPRAADPPDECRTPLRVELQPIHRVAAATSSATGSADDADKTAPKKKEKEKEKSDRETKVQENPCREGYVFAEGVCTKAQDQAHLCDPKNAAECRAQCDKGSGASCMNLGAILRKQKAPPSECEAVFKKGCDHGVADSCAEWGNYVMPNDIEKKDKPDMARVKKGLEIWKRACDDGSADGCNRAGGWLDMEDTVIKRDTPLAVTYMERGCKLGDGTSCAEASAMYLDGDNGIPKDTKKAMSLLVRACDGGDATQCGSLADFLATGLFDVAKDPEGAVKAAHAACDLDVDECEASIDTVKKLAGKQADAFAIATQGCERGALKICRLQGDMYWTGRGTTKDPVKAKASWTKACKDGKGSKVACKRLAEK
ncbi:MAG: sel1 repeat family protein [Polyangiaceae bacterium]|nr:sel1 repeat family protein [Polyangiaceae bacterium]